MNNREYGSLESTNSYVEDGIDNSQSIKSIEEGQALRRRECLLLRPRQQKHPSPLFSLSIYWMRPAAPSPADRKTYQTATFALFWPPQRRRSKE